MNCSDVTGSPRFCDYDVWEVSLVAEGSATAALRMAVQLGHRITLGAVVDRVSLSPPGCTVVLETSPATLQEKLIEELVTAFGPDARGAHSLMVRR